MLFYSDCRVEDTCCALRAVLLNHQQLSCGSDSSSHRPHRHPASTIVIIQHPLCHQLINKYRQIIPSAKTTPNNASSLDQYPRIIYDFLHNLDGGHTSMSLTDLETKTLAVENRFSTLMLLILASSHIVFDIQRLH